MAKRVSDLLDIFLKVEPSQTLFVHHLSDFMLGEPCIVIHNTNLSCFKKELEQQNTMVFLQFRATP